MPGYRCFFIGADGRIANVLFDEHASDDDALSWAFSLCRRNPEYKQVELWEGDRVVHGGPPRDEG